MPTCVVFDCESDGKPTSGPHRGEKDFRYVQCTVACALVLDSDGIALPDARDDIIDAGRKITCWRDEVAFKGANPFEPLLKAFDEAEIIVGFNTLAFDFPLLHKHYGGAFGKTRYQMHRYKALDVFDRLRAVTGAWHSLDSLLTHNGLSTKTGSGAFAVTLWEQQRREELQAYCECDVKLTAQLALLPRLKFPTAPVVPSHVYGIGPAMQAAMAARAQVEASKSQPRPRAPSPVEIGSGDDSDFVMVTAANAVIVQ